MKKLLLLMLLGVLFISCSKNESLVGTTWKGTAYYTPYYKVELTLHFVSENSVTWTEIDSEYDETDGGAWSSDSYAGMGSYYYSKRDQDLDLILKMFDEDVAFVAYVNNNSMFIENWGDISMTLKKQ
jgi:hypothetical protein